LRARDLNLNLDFHERMITTDSLLRYHPPVCDSSTFFAPLHKLNGGLTLLQVGLTILVRRLFTSASKLLTTLRIFRFRSAPLA
jgi:hypothetical protein